MKTALVLSGGGVLGAAHIGALEALDERGFRPDFVVGTSAGAIVGSLYATGGTVLVNEFMDALAETLGSRRTYLLNTPYKLFEFVGKLLAEYVPRDYGKLNIPFYPVATNIRTGTYKAFSKGDLVADVMASAAYPGVFPVQEVAGESYVDGGLTANLPVTVAKELGATYIIASSIYALPKMSSEQTRRLNIITTIERSLDIIQAGQAREQEALSDFCFTPPVQDGYHWYHMRALPEIREAGRIYARKRIAALPPVPKRGWRLPGWQLLLPQTPTKKRFRP